MAAMAWGQFPFVGFPVGAGHGLRAKSGLTASLDATARMWDSSSGECKQTFSGHTGVVTSAAFSA